MEWRAAPGTHDLILETPDGWYISREIGYLINGYTRSIPLALINAHVLNSDEYIIEAMNVPDYSWDDMHHHSYLLPQDAFTPRNPHISILLKPRISFHQDMPIGSRTRFLLWMPFWKATWPIFNPP